MSEEPTITPEAAPVAAPFLSMSVDGRACAVEVGRVREVMRVAAITRIPGAPAHLRGVTSLRGRVIPVIDLGVLFAERASPTATDDHARIVVVERGDRWFGVLVDRVGKVGAGAEGARVVDVDALAGTG